MIVVRKISKECAEQTLYFFDTHPDRDTCVVGHAGETEHGGTNLCMVEYTRADIPLMKAIVAQSSASPPTPHHLYHGCKVKVKETCFVIGLRGKSGIIVGHPPYPSDTPVVKIEGWQHALPASELMLDS